MDNSSAAWWTGFWEYLTEQERRALVAAARERHYRAEESILHESEPSNHVLIIKSGWAKITSLDSEGREVILALRGPGDIIGEMEALIDDPRRSAGVRSLSEGVIGLVIPSARFREFLNSYPTAWFALYKVLAFRLRESNRNAREFGRTGVRQALARLLLDLAARHGCPDRDGTVVVTLLSQDEIAACIWASRDAVAHELRVFRERRITSTARRSFTIINLPELEKIAQSGDY
jgi:CRP/FNR family transcriptional regulator, cyclic AMP receptor protein